MFVGVGVGVGRQRVSGGAFVGLLDLYPSASVAYSLRKLSSTYTGNAIRVRRSSDNTEQNIGFDALGNLDTTALTTFCSGTNGFITTWYDQSGNGRNMTQVTATAQPQIVISGSIILDNGKPAIIGDRLNMTMATSSFSVSQPATKFIVCKSTSDANNVVFSSSLNTSSRHQITYLISNGGQFSLFAGASLLSNTINLFNLKVIVYALFNGSNSEIRINNNNKTIGNAGTQNNDGVALGTPPAAFLGYMQEIIYYPSNQSSNEANIRSNINNYYAIY